MTDQIAILAQIRPGQRPALEHLLENGPPFDLAAEGFEHHEVFLGDTDVIFVFTGPGALSQLERVAAARDGFSELLKMSTLVTAPRILSQTFEWQKTHAEAAVSA